MKNPIILFILCLLIISCQDENYLSQQEITTNDSIEQEEPERNVESFRDPFRLIEFAVEVPNTITVDISSPHAFNLEIFAQDCCISDDVVEVWVDNCLVAIVDSRPFPDFSHPGETVLVENLLPGTHTVSYINTISSVGVSGWYVEESNSPATKNLVIDGCDTGTIDFLMPSCRNFSDAIAECAIGAKNHGKFVSCVAHLTETWLNNGWITEEQKDAIVSCAARADIP